MANRTRHTANLASDNNVFVDASTDRVGMGTTTPTEKLDVNGKVKATGFIGIEDWFVIAVSDETTNLTTGTNKVYFRMPYAGELLAVKATVNTAPTGSAIEVDINEDVGSGPVSVLSTVLTIDASEKTSATATVQAVISDSALADDAEITIDIDQVGSTVAGLGLKVYLKVRRS